MRSYFILLLVALSARAVDVDWQSVQTKRGDKFPDFSYVGYRRGDHKLPSSKPHEPTVVIPASKFATDDQTSEIQTALDNVAAAGGGVVELASGRHFLAGNTSIIVRDKTWLRGADRDNTSVYVKGAARSVFSIGTANVKATTAANSNITDAYVPIGASQFAVFDASRFKVNQTVFVQRAVSAAWVSDWVHPIFSTPTNVSRFEQMGWQILLAMGCHRYG
jgi:hypothetical protein